MSSCLRYSRVISLQIDLLSRRETHSDLLQSVEIRRNDLENKVIMGKEMHLNQV